MRPSERFTLSSNAMPFNPAHLPSVFEIDIDASTPAIQTVTPATETGSVAGFAALGVPAKLVRELKRGGITEPFEIQTATIPDALSGRDVLGRGQTGSGKTLAFGLAVLARLATGGRTPKRRPKALVLVPTRELAMQVSDVLAPLARQLGRTVATAFGGAPYDRQILNL